MFFGGDPFEHFAHGGGGGSRRSARPAANVDTTKLYETLGVSAKLSCMHIVHQSHDVCLNRLVKLPLKRSLRRIHHIPVRDDFTFECMPPQSD